MKFNKFNKGDKVKVRDIFPELNKDYVWAVKYVLKDNNYMLISDSNIEIVIHAYDLEISN
ncbi:MAG: hypothetical protein H5T96_09520 [Tissierellales bacterium]|nr:hypothetical protein [Tissierellales bacterium]